MKNYELFVLSDQIQKKTAVLNTLKGAKLAYALTKNIKMIDDAIKSLYNIVEPSEKYKAYDTARVAMCEKFCKKDDTGALVKRPTTNNQFEYDIDMENPLWLDAIDALKIEHKEAIDDRTQQIDKYNEVLDEECEVAFVKVKLEHIPDEITTEIMQFLDFMVTEK